VNEKASKLEILGAWLGLWTPPRDVEIPPVPWRKVGYAALALAGVIAVIALVVAPAIDDAKDEASARDRAERAEQVAARRARLVKLQQPRFGRAPADAPRTAMLERLQEAIGRDARARFSPNAGTATCEPAPGVDESAARVAYDCLSATSEIRGGGAQAGARGQLGYPYRAIVDFAAGRYAFCRTNPVPSEGALGDPRKVIRLPKACAFNR